MTSKGESERRGLPAGWEWREDEDGFAVRLYPPGRNDLGYAAVSYRDGSFVAYLGADTSEEIASADLDEPCTPETRAAAQRAAEAALWARDGFGVGEVRGVVLGDEWAMPVGFALDAPKSCPMALPGLLWLWTLTRVSSARPITVDAVRAPVAEPAPATIPYMQRAIELANLLPEAARRADEAHARMLDAQTAEPASTDADVAPLTHALDAEGNALCPYDPATLAYVSPRHERVTCPACVEKVQATAEPAPREPSAPNLHDQIRASSFVAPVKCSACGANVSRWIVRERVSRCNGCGALTDHRTEPSAPAPTDDQGAELARPSPDRAAWLLHPVSATGRETIAASQYEELRAEAVALRARVAELEHERERVRSALRPYHAPTRDEGSYERTLGRVLAELGRLRADDGSRLRGIVAKNHELTDALGAAEEERDTLRARYRETLLAFDEAAPDALRALRQRQHDAAKPSPEMIEKIREALRKKPAAEKEEDCDVDE